MRAVLVIIFLAMCVLIGVAYKAFQQEFTLRSLRMQIDTTTTQLKAKEEEILNAKLKIQQLNDELMPLNKERDALVKKKNTLTKAKGEYTTKLSTCQSQKTEADKKKTQSNAALEKLKGDQKADEEKDQKEIQTLQKQILDRDAKICKYLDPTQPDGKKLCDAIKATR